jgi:hypothetical protein
VSTILAMIDISKCSKYSMTSLATLCSSG